MMAFIAALGLLMVGICPAVTYWATADGQLGRHTAVQKDRDHEIQLDSVTLASINTDFAFSLYKKLALENPHKNIVFSPLSISAALALMSLGAKGNTLEEILEGLKFNLPETPEADIHQNFGHLLQMLIQPENQVQINAGNALFIDKHLQILTEFKEKARALYKAEAFTTDFQRPREATKLINDYVRKQTQGKIKELVSDLHRNTSMALVNFLNFQGFWNVTFDPEDTFLGNFTLDRKRTVNVPMMKTEELTTNYFRDEEMQSTVVELNYIGNASFLFILPDQGRIQHVEDSLQPQSLRKWRKSLRPRMLDELSLPKFSLSQDYNLNDILPELGIKEVFSTQADLSGITGAKNIRVSQMIHQAALDVTETHTEADVITIARYNFQSAKIKAKIVKVDREFLYLILDPMFKSISVMGKVINPLTN